MRKITLACAILLVSCGAIVLGQDSPATQPAEERHGWLGVRFTDLSDPLAEQIGLPDANGVYILEVVKDSPAQFGGVREMDVILRMDDTDIANHQEMRAKMRTTRPGQVVRLIVFRKKTEHALTVKLGERPAQPQPSRVPRPDAVN